MIKSRVPMFVALIALFSVFPASLAAQTPTPPAHPLYFDVQREPTIRHGESGTWDGRYTDPGAVAYLDGKFHMFRNGFPNWPAPVGIAHLTSEDGLTWQPVGDEPIIRPEDVPFNTLATLATTVMLADDGTWVLYFYTYPDQSLGEGGMILRATAPAPDGPWTFDADPVLTPGAPGTWDGFRIGSPAVVKTDDGSYTMFYEGLAVGGPGHSAIGMATSPDGVHWTKYNDPATADALHSESDPVFTAADVPWMPDTAHQPRVVLTPDGFAMLYRTYNGRQQDMAMGLAFSDDGLYWRNASDEPVLKWNDRSVLSQLWYSALAYANGDYYGYFEIALGQTTNIHASKLVGLSDD